MSGIFTKNQIDNITTHWGNDFYLKIRREVRLYAEKWKLSDVKFHEYYSVNAIFFCESEYFGNCVLKIGGDCQDYEFLSEYNMLCEYNGRRLAHVYDADIDISKRKKVMLIERFTPAQC